MVLCKYCNKQFDREKEEYVQIPMGSSGLRHRYAHADCYIKAKENGTETATYEIWDPATSTTCFWCHKPIFPKQDNVMPMPQIPNRYVHKKCNEEYPKTD